MCGRNLQCRSCVGAWSPNLQLSASGGNFTGRRLLFSGCRLHHADLRGTYYRPDGQFLLAPYCNRYCDTNSDCPLFFRNGPESYNLQMKCIVTSSGVIQPLVGGHCAHGGAIQLPIASLVEVAWYLIRLALMECRRAFANSLENGLA